MAIFPSFKLQPNTIELGLLLETINTYEGNYKEIEKNLFNLWSEKSKRIRTPNMRNSLRAVIGPSLRHLGLAQGEKDDFRLTGIGKRILKAYLDGGEAKLKKEFAVNLINMDKEKWIDLLGFLYKTGGVLRVKDIMDMTMNKTSDAVVTKDKMNKYLKFFEYADLVFVRDMNVKIRKKQYEAAKSHSFTDMSLSEFSKIFIEKYMELKRNKEYYSGTTVAIPDIKDLVLENVSIFSDDFDELLRSIPKETKEYIIQFSQPMTRKAGGINIGNKYFYYVAVYML